MSASPPASPRAGAVHPYAATASVQSVAYPFLASPSLLRRRLSSTTARSVSASSRSTSSSSSSFSSSSLGRSPSHPSTEVRLSKLPSDEDAVKENSDHAATDAIARLPPSSPSPPSSDPLPPAAHWLPAAPGRPPPIVQKDVFALARHESAASPTSSSTPTVSFSAAAPSPDGVSLSTFFSSAPPSSGEVRFLNTVLLYDRSCVTLCAVNLLIYFTGLGGLLLLARYGESGRYVDTYSTGFWHGFHVWCCLSATLLLFVLFSQPSSKKQRISAISLCILLVCVFTYLAFATSALPVYTDVFGHELYPLRYLEWICTTPLMLLLVCNLDVQGLGVVLRIVVLDVAMIVSGAIASISPSMPVMGMWLLLSFLCQFDTLWHMHLLFSRHRRAVRSYQRIARTIDFLEVWLYITYSFFPIVWLCAAMSLIDDQQTSALYFVGDSLGKMLYTAALLVINLEIIDNQQQLQRVQYEADVRVRMAHERMRSEESSARHALTSNERKREFLRYFLHEVRVPLNALVLGLESLKLNCDRVTGGGEVGADDSPAAAGSPSSSPRFVDVKSPHASSLILGSGRLLSRASSLAVPGPGAGSSGGPPSPSAHSLSSSAPLSLYEEDSDSVHEMWLSVSNMTRLLDDVLSLQRIEDGELLLQRAPFVVQDTVLGAVKMMASWLNNKALTVHTAVDQSLRPVISDEYRLRQILLNFLSNAIRFTPTDAEGRPGGAQDITLTVERCPAFTDQAPSISSRWDSADAPKASPQSAPSSASVSPTSANRLFLRLSVRDRGIGISIDNLDRLFTPFVQISTGESEKGKRTGLGLSICRKLIEMLGGRIGVISAPGKGSEFFVEAPFDLADASATVLDTFGKREVAQRRRDDEVQLPQSGQSTARTPSVAAESPAPPKPTMAATDGRCPSPTASAARRSSLSGDESLIASSVRASSSNADSPSPAMRSPTTPVGSPSSGTRPIKGRPSIERPKLSGAWRSSAPALRVLVVDDAESNRKLLARLISKGASAVCDLARDGQEAVDMVSGDVERYDVVLCDKEMPVLDGYGAVRAMRSLGVACPIIGVTANALLSDQAEFMACGLDALVTKPVNLHQLMKAIQDTIADKKGHRTPAPQQQRPEGG